MIDLITARIQLDFMNLFMAAIKGKTKNISYLLYVYWSSRQTTVH